MYSLQKEKKDIRYRINTRNCFSANPGVFYNVESGTFHVSGLISEKEKPLQFKTD